MSVILDALHKARGDKGRGGKSESQPHSVARVLDHGAAPGVVDFNGDRPMPRRRGRLGTSLVTFGLLCLIALVGGGFYLLYEQVRRLEQKTVLQAVTEPATVPVQAESLLQTSPLDVAPPTTLPTPLPLSDLPVQPPAGTGAAAAAPAAEETAAVSVQQPAVERPQFKLGSIVCEAGLCVASLNGKSVRVGDEIRGYNVLEITETAVSLKSATGSDSITLSQFD